MSQNYSLEPMAGSLLNMALKDRPLRVKTKSKLDDACEPPEGVGGWGQGGNCIKCIDCDVKSIFGNKVCYIVSFINKWKFMQ